MATGARILPGFAKAITGEALEIARAVPDLANVAHVQMQFSPWNQNSTAAKQVWRSLGGENCRISNRFCTFKIIVEHKNSDPKIDLTFNDGSKLCLIGTHLKYLEMMYYINQLSQQKDNKTDDKPKVLF